MYSLPPLRSSRSTCRFHGEIQPWKTYEHHVRDSFYAPNQALKRTQSSADIGPSILLQDVYPPDLTASFGGRVQLRDQYQYKKRITHSAGYLPRVYVEARADMYPNRRFYDIGPAESHDKATDDHFHMYRPWKVHLPGTYPTTWATRYENLVKGNLADSAALVKARRSNPVTYTLSGDYRSPIYWNAHFGDRQSPAPYFKNPWYLGRLHYANAYRGY